MSLVKWMRINKSKIMAVVVIILMFAFVGGSALDYLFRPSGGMHKAIAYYGQHQKITPYDLSVATQELEILQALQLDAVLAQQRDLRWPLLGELVFSQSRGSAAVMNQIMQIVQSNQLPIGEKQLSELSEHTAQPSIYWILLCREAASAGVRTPTELAGRALADAIPQLFPNQTYTQVMQGITNRFRVSESDVVTVVSHMLSVLEYARTVCSMEDVTLPQLTHMAAWTGDSIDANIVQFDAKVFADKTSTPTDEAIRAQFDTYKGNFAGRVTPDNPFGFGYKLPDRLQLEYVALKLTDVEKLVPAVTHEDAMEFYRQNRETLFLQEVPSNPNDPNSATVQRPRSYADVEDTILQQLKMQRVNTKAEQILDEVKNVADANLPELGVEGSQPGVEDLKSKAGDYSRIAREVAAKESITLYSGQTGWLDAAAVRTDEHLSNLYVVGSGAAAMPLSQILFSTKALGEDAGVLMFGNPPRMHSSIGPARDPMGMRMPDLSDQIMLITRIVGVAKAGSPEGPDVVFSTKSLELGEPAKTKKTDTYSVKDKVVEDLRMLAAWDTTKAKAEEFVAMAAKDGWKPAVDKYNDLYGKAAKEEPNDPNVFRLSPLPGLRQIPNAQLQMIAAQAAGTPGGYVVVDQAEVEQRLMDQLFALVPAGESSAPNMPQVMEFKPGQCFYVIQSLSATWLDQQQYEMRKPILLQREDTMRSQTLYVTHFSPANILKRMNFQYVQERPSADDTAKTEEKAKGTT